MHCAAAGLVIRAWSLVIPSTFGFRHSTLADALSQFRDDVLLVNPPLLEAITVAHGDGAVLQCLAIDGDAERRAGFVLAAIAAADGPLFVVENRHVRLDGPVKTLSNLRHAVFLDERKHGGLDRRDARVKAHH